MTDPAIRARGLVRSFGTFRAVDGLDLSVHQGEIYGFLGRNGAGKTTTLRLLMGILGAQGGEIEILGERVARPGRREKQRIGYVAQEQHFYPWMTGRELADFVGGLYPSWDDAEMLRLARALDVPLDRRAGALSHGTQVKLALVLALAPRPPLLVLDEPTAGLDPVARREFLDIVHEQSREAGRTVLFSTHLVDEVERVADRIGIVDRGRLLYEGSIEGLRASVRRLVLTADQAAALPSAFRVIRSERGAEGTTLIAEAPSEAWTELGARGLPSGDPLSLEDAFIALVARGTAAG